MRVESFVDLGKETVLRVLLLIDNVGSAPERLLCESLRLKNERIEGVLKQSLSLIVIDFLVDQFVLF